MILRFCDACSILSGAKGVLLRRVNPLLTKSMRRAPTTLLRAADAQDILSSRRHVLHCTHFDVCFTSMVILSFSSVVNFAVGTPGTWGSTGAFSLPGILAGDLALVGTGCVRL